MNEIKLYKKEKCPYFNGMGSEGLDKCIANSELCHNYDGDCDRIIEASKADILTAASKLITVTDEEIYYFIKKITAMHCQNDLLKDQYDIFRNFIFNKILGQGGE